MDLTEKFYLFHKKEETFQTSDRVLVAFSGGKDSVCLLLLLSELKKRLGIFVGACHVNHMIRPDAQKDLLFCRQFCKEHKIPFFAKESNVPLFCKTSGVGLEEGARLERYRLLQEVANKEAYTLIATAHTASDQAETVLFRILRGTGLDGAGGIPIRRGNLVRPLLPFYQEEILAFLDNLQAPFTQDSTNRDIIYARNRLRHNVIPELRKINPGAEDALARFGTLAQYHSALLKKLCDTLETSQNLSFSTPRLPLSYLTKFTNDKADFPILYEIVSRMAKTENITIDFDHFLRVLSLLKKPSEGKIIEISNGYFFVIRQKNLCFAKYEVSPSDIQYKVELNEGENEITPTKQRITLFPSDGGKLVNVNKKALKISLSADTIEGKLFARGFQDGDKIRMYGMSKSVKKLFCDAGIPRALRPFIPIVCDQKEIIWLPFFGLCDKVRQENAKHLLTLATEGEKTDQIQALLNEKRDQDNFL